MPRMDEEQAAGSWLPALVETSFGMLVAAAAVVHPPAAIVAAASPALGHAVLRVLQDRTRDGQAVFDEEGVTTEDVEEAMGRNEAVFDLGRQAVEGLLDARNQAHRRVLARALASGVLDDAKVEPELRVVRTVSQLDVPEILALKVLCQPRPERANPDDPDGQRYADTVFPDEARTEWGQEAMVVEEVMAKLVGLGLAYDRATVTLGGVLHWQVTEYGRLVTTRLDAEAPLPLEE
jgi:hypothetical protein